MVTTGVTTVVTTTRDVLVPETKLEVVVRVEVEEVVRTVEEVEEVVEEVEEVVEDEVDVVEEVVVDDVEVGKEATGVGRPLKNDETEEAMR